MSRCSQRKRGVRMLRKPLTGSVASALIRPFLGISPALLQVCFRGTTAAESCLYDRQLSADAVEKEDRAALIRVVESL